MAKKATPSKKHKAPAPAPKHHERKATPKEADLLERGRKLVADMLVKRDGMDPQVALDVVEAMGADDINQMIEDANTTVIEKPKPSIEEVVGARMPEPPAPKKEEGDHQEPVEFYTIEALVTNEQFPALVMATADAARTKNRVEKEYKALKQEVIKVLDAAHSPAVRCMEVDLYRYQGHAVGISADKLRVALLEAKVDPDLIPGIIAASRYDTPYEDVRVVYPKEV